MFGQGEGQVGGKMREDVDPSGTYLCLNLLNSEPQNGWCRSEEMYLGNGGLPQVKGTIVSLP